MASPPRYRYTPPQPNFTFNPVTHVFYHKLLFKRVPPDRDPPSNQNTSLIKKHRPCFDPLPMKSFTSQSIISLFDNLAPRTAFTPRVPKALLHQVDSFHLQHTIAI